MQQLVTVVGSGAPSGPQVRVDSCPVCRRPLHLAHAGVVDAEGEYLDLGMVAFAQSLHAANCRG